MTDFTFENKATITLPRYFALIFWVDFSFFQTEIINLMMFSQMFLPPPPKVIVYILIQTLQYDLAGNSRKNNNCDEKYLGFNLDI